MTTRTQYLNNADQKKGNAVWLHVTAGQGPEECGWVVAQVVKVMLKEAVEMQIDACIVEAMAFEKALRNQNLIEPESYRSVLLKFDGSAARKLASSWVGSIKWQGESVVALKQGRPNHKRFNWYVGVVEQHVAASDRLHEDIPLTDLSFEAIRSSGPGGQHVNKTSSAVRLTHIPTGIQVRVDTDRSQHRNKQLAMERLKMILAEESKEKQRSGIRDRWLDHYQVSRGSPVRTFVGSDFIEKQ